MTNEENNKTPDIGIFIILRGSAVIIDIGHGSHAEKPSRWLLFKLLCTGCYSVAKYLCFDYK